MPRRNVRVSANQPGNGNNGDDFKMTPVVMVSLDDVVVPDYQRMFQDNWAQEIAQNWNPLLFRPPLYGRREDGKLDVIDGQHTVAALKLRGHTQAPGFIRDALPPAEEAGAFADLNTRRRGLRPFEVWRAEALAGREWAVELRDIAAKYGLRVAQERSPLTIACVSECRRTLRRPNGAQLLDQALDILTHAYADPSDPANETRVERGLVAGMVDLLDRAQPTGRLFERERWIERLQGATFRVEGQTTPVTPRSFPSYIATLIATGKMQLTSVQTGSGQGIIWGRALSLIILGDAKTRQLYK